MFLFSICLPIDKGGKMKKAITLAVTAMMLFALFAACSTSSQDEIIVTQFLNEFYTIDKPDQALKDLAIVDEKGEPEAYVALTKDKFLKYFTNDGFFVFLVSPEWMSLYTRAAVNNYTVDPTKMKIEKADKNNYKFSLVVTIKDEQNNIIDEIPQSGELVLKSGKIDHFTIVDENIA